jgi:hypothetical protein
MTSRLSTDHRAVRHILTAAPIAARTAPYIGDDDFDWNGLLSEAQTMSGGERVLVRLAYDLWEPNGLVGVWELARRLDRRSFERVVAALEMSRGESEELRVAA